MRGFRVDHRAISAQLHDALGVESPAQQKHRALRTWADGIVADMRAEGRTMDSVAAIFAALYQAQRAIKVPNSYLTEVLTDMAKEMVKERAKAGEG